MIRHVLIAALTMACYIEAYQPGVTWHWHVLTAGAGFLHIMNLWWIVARTQRGELSWPAKS